MQYRPASSPSLPKGTQIEKRTVMIMDSLFRLFKNIRATLFMIASCTMIILSASAQTPEPGPAPIDALSDSRPAWNPTDLEAFLDGVVRGQLDAHQIPGATVAITSGEDIILIKGYGYADVESETPVDPEQHLFRVASVSKPFAWISLLQLAEEGLIDLNADVNTYLDFEIPDTYPGTPVRIKHLITHTTGFEAVNFGGTAKIASDQIPFDEAMKTLIPKRVSPPGVRTNYSNYGAALGGYIVQRVSGKPYYEYLEEEIFTPLSMDRTSMRQPPPEGLFQALATGYTQGDEGLQKGHYNYLNIYPDGALATTAGDMTKFAIAVLNPEVAPELLTPESFKLMREVQFANVPQVAGMTYGFEQKIWNGRHTFGHGGDMNFYKAKLIMMPEENVSIFIAMNSDDIGSATTEITQAFMDRYFEGPDADFLFSDAPLENASDDIATSYTPTRRNHSSIEKLLWPIMVGVNIERVDDEKLFVSFFGETHLYERRSTGVYVPAASALNAMVSVGALLSTKDPETGARKLYVSQQGSFAFEEPKPIERLSLHKALAILVGVLSISGLLLILFSVMRARENSTKLGWSAAGAAGISVILLVIFLVRLSGSFNADLVYGIPSGFHLTFALPLIATALSLAAVMASGWTLYRRETSVTLQAGTFAGIAATFLFCWQLSIWNMYGFGGLSL